MFLSSPSLRESYSLAANGWYEKKTDTLKWREIKLRKYVTEKLLIAIHRIYPSFGVSRVCCPLWKKWVLVLSFSTFLFNPYMVNFRRCFSFFCFLFLAACNSTFEPKVGLWRNKLGIFFQQMVEFTYGKVSTRTLPAKIMAIMSFGIERASVKIKWCWCGETRADFMDLSL